ncbi:MAG: phospho-2-dehydro-3-deoxyheptonate aldolase [Firmicutes bacterium]|nr:phospho-2-dehydro-3-deoxyheptonate aldolase [Bacillota bacterium]
MIVIIKSGTSREKIEELKSEIEMDGCRVSEVEDEGKCTLGLIRNSAKANLPRIEANSCVEKVSKVQQPYKLANRLFHPCDTVIAVNNETIGGNKLAVMAGPCSVESEEQIVEIAKLVKASGAGFLRGGAFKPRTSPYSFQGLKTHGLELLKIARQETGLPIVTEIMSADMIGEFVQNVDVIQVGARNMQNFELLKELGKTKTPILLKRGFSATIEELIMSAEYIMAGGNENVILCERGIRTFETYTRNTLDLSAIPAIKRLSHLPVIVDPSHASGLWRMVSPLSKAAVAVGADGLMIEVHNDPENAQCDGQQSIRPERFKKLMEDLRPFAGCEKKVI